VRQLTRIAVVIVNYKTPELVARCLDSLANEQREGWTIRAYVGDAASGDGSTEIINRHIAEQGFAFASCFDIGGNHGFAYGNNYILARKVLRDADADYVWFLNPDTYVLPGALAALIAVLRAHPGAGVAGSRLENPDGSLRAYGFRFPAPWREFFRGARLPLQRRLLPACEIQITDLHDTRRVDWVSGASFMMPLNVIQRVGLMDARYFLYFEEVEYMARVRDAGFEIWHASDSRVVHLAGQATGVRAGDKPRRLPAYWYHSRFRFFCDRYGQGSAILANGLFLLGNALFRVLRALRLKAPGDAPYLWRDMFAHGFTLPTAEGPMP
jgi:GT2 family glycosyltransferase